MYRLNLIPYFTQHLNVINALPINEFGEEFEVKHKQLKHKTCEDHACKTLYTAPMHVATTESDPHQLKSIDESNIV